MDQRSKTLYLLAVINFTHIVDSMLIMPLGDIFIDIYDISASQFSLLVSSYAISAAISALVGLFYMDVFDRKKALLFLYLGFSLGTLLCGFSTSYLMLLSLRFTTGLFGGVIGALILSIVSDLYPFKERGSAMGILMAAFAVASAFGIPMGNYLAAVGSWQIPFIGIGMFGLLVSGVIYWVFPSMTDHLGSVDTDRSVKAVLGNIFGNKNQVNALLAGFFLILGHFLIIPFISPYLIKNVGLSQLDISYQFFFGGIATMISSPIIGKLTDKVGVNKVFLIMAILSFIPTYLITNMPEVSLTIAISICVMFFITATGRMIPPNTVITAAATQSNRGSFMSMKSSLQQLAIALAAIISGVIIHIGEDDTFVHYDKVGYLAMAIIILTIPLVKRIQVAKDN